MKKTDDIDIIHSYSRRDAIADGVLVDVSKLASEAGFRYPVALTKAVYAGYIEPESLPAGDDATGRLWDLLSVFRAEIARGPRKRSRVPFEVYFRMSKGADRLVPLVGVCGPGDDLEPVLTVMEPSES